MYFDKIFTHFTMGLWVHNHNDFLIQISQNEIKLPEK